MSSMPPVTPQLIGQRYQRHERIGAGGMGTVYRGVDTHTGGEVAIKQLNAELVRDTPEMVERFVREGEALRQLNHPNIVKMLDSVQEGDGGAHYLVMELVTGGTLETRLQAHPGGLPVTDALRIALELADALTRAHHLNIIHRDLKPANVLIADDGTPRLTDFGIAYMIERDRVTEGDAIVGTLSYLSPEALNGVSVDGRADIWAFGVMLCEMLTGQHPFDRPGLAALLMAITSEALPDLETLHPDLPIGLIDLLYRMLEKDREARIPSVRQIGALLEGMLRGIDTSEMQTVRPDSSPSPSTTIYENVFDTPTPVTDGIKNNLPHQPTPFVGRETEITEVLRLLNDHDTRLVTLLAPGGMGKTRLALEVAAQFLIPAITSPAGLRNTVQGVYFVNLAPLTVTDRIVAVIAEAVGFQFYPGGEPKQQLLDYLREKTLLLILDNFEHLLDGVEIVGEILQTAAGVTLLATSRQRLNLRGETLYTLDGMDFPDWETPEDALQYSAVKLFMGSARRVNPGFDLHADDLRYVARICRLVQGMPLGIELAASWIDALTLHEIADEIEKSLDFLETDLRDMPERHRSLRAVFDYSWNLLTDEERKIFVPLAVFRGGFSRDAAHVVVGATLRQLTALVNKSLLKRDPESGDYSVHEMLRQYAEEKLESSGEANTVHAAHSRYYIEALIGRTADLEGKDQLGAFKIADREVENGQMAWLWALTHHHFDLIGRALYPLWLQMFLRGQYQDGVTAFGVATHFLRQTHASPERDIVFAHALARYAHFCVENGERDKSEAALTESASLLAQTQVDVPLVNTFLDMARGQLHLRLKNPVDARPYFESALAFYRERDNLWNAMFAAYSLSISMWLRLDTQHQNFALANQYAQQAYRFQQILGGMVNRSIVLHALVNTNTNTLDEETNYLNEIIAISREIGHRTRIATAFNILAVNAMNVGKTAEGQRYFEQSLAEYRETGNLASSVRVMLNLRSCHYYQGDFPTAREYAQQAFNIVNATQLEETWLEDLLAHLGETALAQGDYVTARAFFDRLYAFTTQYNSDRKGLVLSYLGQLALAQGAFDDAYEAFEQQHQLAEQLGVDDYILLARLNLAAWAYQTGHYDRAREFLALSVTSHVANESGKIATVGYWNITTSEINVSLADLALVEGDLATVGGNLREALNHALSANHIPQILAAITSSADLYAAQGDSLRAAEIAAFVAHNRKAFAVDRQRAGRTLESLRSALSPDDYNAAVERGQLAELEAVLAAVERTLSSDV